MHRRSSIYIEEPLWHQCPHADVLSYKIVPHWENPQWRTINNILALLCAPFTTVNFTGLWFHLWAEGSWQGQMLCCPRLCCVCPSRSHQEQQDGRKEVVHPIAKHLQLDSGRRKERGGWASWNCCHSSSLQYRIIRMMNRGKRKDCLEFCGKYCRSWFWDSHVSYFQRHLCVSIKIDAGPKPWQVWIFVQRTSNRTTSWLAGSGSLGLGWYDRWKSKLCVDRCGFLPKLKQRVNSKQISTKHRT